MKTGRREAVGGDQTEANTRGGEPRRQRSGGGGRGEELDRQRSGVRRGKAPPVPLVFFPLLEVESNAARKTKAKG